MSENGLADLSFGRLAFSERPLRRDPGEPTAGSDIYQATPAERAGAVGAALDAGIRLFHAAHEREAASLGASLRTLGARGRVLVGTTDGDALDRCPDTEAGAAQAVTGAVQRKQELLGVETLDVFLLYDFRPGTHTPARLAGARQALDAARAAGRVRWTGVTCYGAYDALAEAIAGETLSCDLVAARCNFLDQRASVRLLPLCRERGVRTLAAQPLAWVGGVPFVRFPNTWRFRNLTRSFYGFTAAQAHLHWVLARTDADGVLVSMQTPEQVRENAAALALPAVPAGLESLFESFAQAITGTREGWTGLLADDQWEYRAAAEAYLSRQGD